MPPGDNPGIVLRFAPMSETPPSRPRSRPVLLPWFVLALSWLTLGGLIALALQAEHSALGMQEGQRLARQAEALQRHLSHELQVTDEMLAAVRAELPSFDTQPGGRALLTRYLRTLDRGLFSVRSLTLVDAKGQVLASSREAPEQEPSRVLPRQLGADADPQRLYMVPSLTNLQGGQGIELIKVVRDAQGRISGNLIAELDPEYLGLPLRSALHAPDMQAMLTHDDGVAIYRTSAAEGRADFDPSHLPESLTARHLRSGRESSLFHGVTESTQEPGLIALRNVRPERSASDRPLLLLLSRQSEAIYAGWRKQLAIQATLSSLVALCSMLVLLRLQRRERMHEHSLVEQRSARACAEQKLRDQQTGLDQAEAKLRDSEARFSRVLEDMRQAVILMEGRHCIAANRTALAMLRIKRLEHLLESAPMEFSPLFQPDGRPSAEKAAEMLWIASELGSNVFEWELLRGNGEAFMARVLLTVIEQGGKKLLHIVLHDITEQKKAREEIAFLAFHDALTGLPNRILGREQLQRALTGSPGSRPGLAVLHIIVHGLSSVNEAYGQSVGDHLLLSVAMRLGRVLRAQDLLSRRAGDGFMAVLPEIDSYPLVSEICDQILARCCGPFGIEGMQIGATLSIGAAFHPRDAEEADALIRNADMALRQARKAGPGSCFFFEPRMNAALERFMLLREMLRQGLERGEFELRYQPRLNLARQQAIGVEVSLYWRHDDQIEALTDERLEAARDSGLIVPIGRWALASACRQAESWRARGLDIYVSVGLSELQCQGGQGERDIQAALDGCQLEPDRIELLLPASVLRRHDEATVALLERCTRRGMRLCLDGYGGGYLNLAYLKRLGIDKFKFELSDSMSNGALDWAALRFLLQGAQALGLGTAVGGAEDEDTLQQLRALGCDEAQGGALAPALAVDEFERWLAAQG